MNAISRASLTFLAGSLGVLVGGCAETSPTFASTPAGRVAPDNGFGFGSGNNLGVVPGNRPTLFLTDDSSVTLRNGTTFGSGSSPSGERNGAPEPNAAPAETLHDTGVFVGSGNRVDEPSDTSRPVVMAIRTGGVADTVRENGPFIGSGN